MSISTLLLVLSPIYVKPGQCILVGSQEVCALQADTAPSTSSRSPTVIHSCHYGDLERPDTQGASKGWNHMMITLKDDGSKVETLVKSYGPLDEHKKECELDVRKLQTINK